MKASEAEEGIPLEEDVDLLANAQAQVAIGELFPMIRALGEAEAEAAAAAGHSKRWITRAKKQAVLGRYEREYRERPDHEDFEIVLVGADSRETLEVTHSRYFKRGEPVPSSQ